jgi:hypothetical protein
VRATFNAKQTKRVIFSCDHKWYFAFFFYMRGSNFIFTGNNGGIPQPVYNCTHSWKTYSGPVPCVAFTVPHFEYECALCRMRATSQVKIPTIANKSEQQQQCNHEFSSDPLLGESYKMYQVCAKCGLQK